MEEAMQRAEQADALARRNLTRASQEATSTGAESMTQVGSYTDYLKAKKDARNAWAAVSQSTGDPRLDAVREARSRNAGLRASESANELAGREERLGQRVGESFSARQANAAAMDAWRRQQAEAQDARAKKDAAAKSDYYNKLWDTYRRAQFGPAGSGDFGDNRTGLYANRDRSQMASRLSAAARSGEWTPPQGVAPNAPKWLDQYAREQDTDYYFNSSGRR